MLKLSDFSNVHFIGICGVSMKALALLCKRLGMNVSGSDKAGGETLNILCENGIYAYRGSDNSVVAKADLVVHTACIPDTDAELRFARANKITVMERKAFLALVAAMCDKTVAVAGTHGKTTSTAMISAIFSDQRERFIGHVGGDTCNGDISLCDSGRDWFVTEACEYNRTFLSLNPDIAVILNMQYDHPDCYADMNELKKAFRDFASKIKQGGVLIVDALIADEFDCPHVKKRTLGFSKGCDYRADDIDYKDGRYSFSLYKDGVYVCRVCLSVFGKHNILNALAAIAAATEAGLDTAACTGALQNFCGVKRRFECRGLTAGGERVIVDYAHHPSEIKAAIDTARVMTKGQITAVFEPHTYSRTKSMADGFADAFYWADEVIILPTFAAREKPVEGGSAYDLYTKIKKKRDCLYLDSYEKAAQYLSARFQNGGIILLLGAGSVDRIAPMIVSNKDNK